MSTFSVGIFYLVGATQPKRTRHHFLIATSFVRLIAAYVFFKDGDDARGGAVWDVVMVGLNALVIWYERLAYLSG